MLSADGLPTHLVVTRSGIRTPKRSTVPYRYGFTAAWDALLPRQFAVRSAQFAEKPISWSSRCELRTANRELPSATAARRLVPVIFGAGWLDP